jgi:signal peptidase I
MSLGYSAPAAPPSSSIGRAVARTLGLFVIPVAVALLIMRFVLPSPLEGAGGGVLGFLAMLDSHYPLFAGIAVFLIVSELGRYWTRQLAPSPVEQALPAAGTRRRALRRLVVGLCVAAVLAFVGRASVAATFRVIGPSMLPTLEIGDQVLVNRLAYGARPPFAKQRLFPKDPHRGDLVVFPASGLPGLDGTQRIVKRVVGLPGDNVAFEDGNIVINGWRLPGCDAGPYVDMIGRLTVRGRLVVEFLGDQTYLTVRRPLEPPFAGYTVKPGEVFVVGDDRGLSSDSRLWTDRHGAGVRIDMLDGRVSRVLLGARPDGRLDFSRLLAPPLDLKVRLPGFDMRETDRRIGNCLARRPTDTTPPAPGAAPTRSAAPPREAISG